MGRDQCTCSAWYQNTWACYSSIVLHFDCRAYELTRVQLLSCAAVFTDGVCVLDALCSGVTPGAAQGITVRCLGSNQAGQAEADTAGQVSYILYCLSSAGPTFQLWYPITNLTVLPVHNLSGGDPRLHTQQMLTEVQSRAAMASSTAGTSVSEPFPGPGELGQKIFINIYPESLSFLLKFHKHTILLQVCDKFNKLKLAGS